MTNTAKEMLAKPSNFLEVLESARRQDNKIISVWSGDVDVVTEALAALRLSARQQASMESLAELIAKRWYWDMHSIMHDHDENWRQFEKRELYLSVARYVVRALLAKYDIFEKVEG